MIGGVITSTLLTLLVIPTVYEILDEWREWLGAPLRRRVAVPAAGAHASAGAGAAPHGDDQLPRS